LVVFSLSIRFQEKSRFSASAVYVPVAPSFRPRESWLLQRGDIVDDNPSQTIGAQKCSARCSMDGNSQVQLDIGFMELNVTFSASHVCSISPDCCRLRYNGRYISPAQFSVTYVH